ncbi:MAG: hypothetical protein J7647_21940 [Cyanobacteria bacterium SBLK]|nr:hypothetical protein [Cyanobacteria bacterium SBLK]
MSALQEVQEMDKKQSGVATPEQAPENESGRSSAHDYFQGEKPETKDDLNDFDLAGILPYSSFPVFVARKGTSPRKGKAILNAKRLATGKEELWPTVVACEVCRIGDEFKQIDIYDLENLEAEDFIALSALIRDELGEGLKAYAPTT